MKLRKTNKKGFTLVELIVVIAIIAIIAAIAIPTTIVYVGRANDSAAQSEADSVARTLRESVTSAILTGATISQDYFVTELKEQMGTVEHVTSVTVEYANDTLTFTVKTDRGEEGDEIQGKASVSVADTDVKFEENYNGGTINYDGESGWTGEATT